MVALGEICLDYYWDEAPREQQKDIFIKQIEIAKKYQKPIVIHVRDAYEDTYNILKQSEHYGIIIVDQLKWQNAMLILGLKYHWLDL